MYVNDTRQESSKKVWLAGHGTLTLCEYLSVKITKECVFFLLVAYQACSSASCFLGLKVNSGIYLHALL